MFDEIKEVTFFEAGMHYFLFFIFQILKTL